MNKTDLQKVAVDALPPRAREFRQWSMKPYFAMKRFTLKHERSSNQ
jgi:hypothetical protein